MKKKYKKEIRDLIIVILVGLTLIPLEWSSRRTEERIIKEGDFAIGTFIRFQSRWTNSPGESYEFKYYDKYGKEHTHVASKYVPSGKIKGGIREGDQFLVLYKEKEGGILLFNYPIKDSSDFKHYVKMYDKNRNFKLKCEEN